MSKQQKGKNGIPVVIVGGGNGKTVANYLGAVLHELSNGAQEVQLRARGRATSLAIDTAQSMGRLPGYETDKTATVGTDVLTNGDKVCFVELNVRLANGSGGSNG